MKKDAVSEVAGQSIEAAALRGNRQAQYLGGGEPSMKARSHQDNALLYLSDTIRCQDSQSGLAAPCVQCISAWRHHQDASQVPSFGIEK